MIFNSKECWILTIRDVSKIKQIAQLSDENETLSLLTSSVSHELITPIKCIIAFGEEAKRESESPFVTTQCDLIIDTAGILLC
jgi:signal transduction histidine kinase